MDPIMISEAVASTRAGRAVAVRNRYAGSWSTRFPAINGSGLHIVSRGAPWLILPDAAPVPLGPGSLVFVPHGPPHGFSDEPLPFRALPGTREQPVDPEHPDVEFVSCCYHLDRGRVHDSLTGLPLASIADRLGYATGFSFAAAFRREFGIAPGRFRHREREATP